MNAKTTTAVTLGLAAALFLAVNILSTTLLGSARLDLTEDKLFTLSQGTRNILKSVKEPITLRLFYSDELATEYPSIKTYGARVRDMLREFKAVAGGNLLLEVIDPEPFTEAEDLAVSYGMQGMPTGAGDLLYLGLVGVNSTDAQEAIPFFSQDREQFLEYDLTKLVDSLIRRQRPVIGLVSSLPLAFGPGGPMAAMQGQSRPFVLYEQLAQAFEVRTVGAEFDRVDPDIGALLIVHPPELSESTLYAIDQFVLKGGRALVFVDPYSEIGVSIAQSMGQGMPSEPVSDASDMKALLNAWGVELAQNEVVGDLGRAQRVQMADPTGRRQIVDYMLWLGLRQSELDGRDVVTAELAQLNLASVGHLERVEGATTEMHPLAVTSTETMILAPERLRLQPDPDELTREFRSTERAFTIAARLTGSVASAFPDGPPNSEDEDKASGRIESHLAVSAEPINIIVVADTDLFDDRFWVQVQNFLGQRIAVPIADNASFVINAVDNLIGSNDLISLRSRSRATRPFTLVEEIRREAEASYLTEEKRLEDALKSAEDRIKELESQRPEEAGAAALLSAEQEAEISRFRAEMLDIRKQLRAVQHNLRKDIENLETWLKAINIGLVPLIVLAVALIVTLARYRRRRGAAREAGRAS